MAGSTGVVVAAMVANGAIAILKFGGYLLTGSPSMLSETYHSISDTGNQVFLLIGIRYSQKDPTRAHPFGYGRAQFFFSFLVSVLLFGVAGWESLKHGIEEIGHAGASDAGSTVLVPGVGDVGSVWINVSILLGAIAFETWALLKANEELQRQIRAFEWSGIPEAFRKTSDVTTLTAFTEDSVALGGAVIALAGVMLTEITGREIFDAVTAALIGLLLMGFALALAWQNKRLLLGESLPADVEGTLHAAAAEQEGVVEIDDLRTVFVGPQEAMVTLDVSFDPDIVVGNLAAYIDDIEATLRETDERVTVVYVEPEV